MPVKKKSKGSKLARMSDEERARYLQHRAELELEAKRRKQQLIAAFTKNKLKREEAFSRLNTAKINEQWRFFLRQIKCKELHQDVEHLWLNFDRSMRVKDEIIKKLHNELQIADTDHRRFQEAHITIIDKIMEQHKRRLDCLHDFYVSEMQSITSNDIVELKQLKAHMEKNVREIQQIIFKQEQILTNKVCKIRTQNAVNIYSVVYLKEDVTSDLVQQASAKMEKLWADMNRVLTDYEKTTQSKRKQYEYLKEQDDAHQTDVSRYPKLQSQLQNTIEVMKRDLQTLSQKRGQRISQLKSKGSKSKQEIEEVRHKLTILQLTDSVQLRRLSVLSNKTLKELQKASEKSSQLLQFIKTCSNLEPLLLQLKKYSLQDADTDVIYPSFSNASQPFHKLETFWEQHNQIKADNILLKQESAKLSSENKRLRHTLRKYLITVSGTPIPRPLSIISV